MASNEFDIELTAGTAFSFTILYQDSAGVAIDVTGATFEAIVRASSDVSLAVVLDFSARVTITDAAGGTMSVALTNADTSTWETTGFSGLHEIAIILASGDRKILIPRSGFLVCKRVSS